MDATTNKSKKYLWLFAAFIGLFLLMLAGVSILKYTGKASFYQPIYVSFGNDTLLSGSADVYGKTLFGRKQEFLLDDHQWISGNGFLQSVVIGMADSLWQNGAMVYMVSGKDSWEFEPKEISNNWDVHQQDKGWTYYSSGQYVRSGGSVFSFFFSIFSWTDSQYLLIICVFVFLFVLIAFLWHDFKKVKISSGLIVRIVMILSALVIITVLCFQYNASGRIQMNSGLLVIIVIYILLYFIIHLLLRNRTGLRKKVHVLFAVLFVLWFITEIVLRTTALRTYTENRGGYYQSPYQPQHKTWYHIRAANETIILESPEYSYSRTTNSLGFCDQEPRLSADTSEFRILALGDSFTEGDGAAADSTWPKFLERSLNSQIPAQKITIINAGVSGSDPFFEYVLLRDKLLQYDPDLVIVALAYDLNDVAVRGGMERFLSNGELRYREAPCLETPYALFYMVRLFVHNVLGYDQLLRSKATQLIDKERGVSLLKSIVCTMILYADERKLPLLFAVCPQKSEIKARKYEYWDQLIPEIKKKYTPVTDLLDYYLNDVGIDSSNYTAYYWPQDGHHKAKGYQAFAAGVEKTILKNGFIVADTIAK